MEMAMSVSVKDHPILSERIFSEGFIPEHLLCDAFDVHSRITSSRRIDETRLPISRALAISVRYFSSVCPSQIDRYSCDLSLNDFVESLKAFLKRRFIGLCAVKMPEIEKRALPTFWGNCGLAGALDEVRTGS